MNPFKYEYIKTDNIFKNLLLIKDFSVIELITLSLLIIFFIISIYLIFPTIYFYYKYILSIIEKNKKIYLLKQIAFEKEIEEEMQKEINSN